MARFHLMTRNNFNALSRDVLECFGQVVRDTTDEAVRRAKANAPVLTGALQASIHAVNDERSDYADAASEALARRPPGHPDIFGGARLYPEVRPQMRLHALMAACVEHGAVNEYGGAHFGARPFFVPAVEGLRDDFERDLRACLRDETHTRHEEAREIETGGGAGAAASAQTGGTIEGAGAAAETAAEVAPLLLL